MGVWWLLVESGCYPSEECGDGGCHRSVEKDWADQWIIGTVQIKDEIDEEQDEDD
jgi:hypothetical protein